MSALLSIITVCYNSEKTIESCVKSIVSQKTNELEYVVIDGASKDRTSAILEEYRSGIDLLISEKDEGIYNAMNKALKLAKGEYVLFINSDDQLAENGAQSILQAIKQSKFEILIGSVNVSLNGETGLLRPSLRPGKRIYYTMPVCHQSLVMNRELALRLGGFDEQYRILADFDLLLKAIKNGVEFIEIKAPIAIFELGGAGTGIKHLHEYFHLHQSHGFPWFGSRLCIFRIWLSYHLQRILPVWVVRLIKTLKRSPYPAKSS